MKKQPYLYTYASSWKEHGGQPGLVQYALDLEKGQLTLLNTITERDSMNCSYVDQEKGMLYVCNEDIRVRGADAMSGQIVGYRLDPQSGAAEEAFRKVTCCPNPSYVSLDKEREFLFVAHHSAPLAVARMVMEDGAYRPVLTYAEASVQMYTLDEDGTPDALVDNIDHLQGLEAGQSAHPHCTTVSPDGQFIAVCDKGTGHLYLYRLDRQGKSFRLCCKALTDEPGDAPRYAAFHPTLPYLYVNHEKARRNGMDVAVFQYDAQGTLRRLQIANALPEGQGIPEAAHYEQQGLAISPDGRFLYTLLNGPNAVAVFRIDPDTGLLTLMENVAVRGVRPRALALTPDGDFLLAGCLVSGDITVFRVKEDGTLDETGGTAVQKGVSYFSFYQPKDACEARCEYES
ncbi:MAG: lactonase family protein [Clostridiales bacterium]|nr:lactonase family protein [Clostridiales bacterium]